MSIKLMSAIFETEFRDLPTGEVDDEKKEKRAKASSLKIMMLAIADHANDDGEGSYPGLKRLMLKTGLSRQGVVDVQKACKFNGLLFVADEPSKLGTNDYTINTECFPKLKDPSQVTLLVKSLDYPSQVTLPGVVKSLDLKHPLTTNEPLNGVPPNFPVEWQIAGKNETVTMTDEKHNQMVDAANLIGTGTGTLFREIAAIALAFQTARDKVFTMDDIKGQRKAAKILVNKGIKPEHVNVAVSKLIQAGMTVTDLYSIIKTADDIAHPPPETNGYNPQGLEIRL